MINGNDTRISKLGEYLLNIIDELTNEISPLINANWLSNDISNYSLDRMPTASLVEKWINGIEKHKDTYNFRSRMAYSSDRINNLKNIGFFEKFEEIIAINNKKGVLPQIDGIQEIKCLNSGTLNNSATNTAEFDIQIQITYLSKIDKKIESL